MGSILGFSSLAEFNAYVTFVFLGMSIMMVVSTITSAPSFVVEYYRFATGIPDAVCESPSFWNNANTFFNVGTYVTQALTEGFSLAPFVRKIPLRTRLFVGLIIPFLEMLLIIVIPAITIPTQNGAIAVLMVVSVLGGFSKALCDSSTNALVGPFPTKFMNGAQWGLTISALFMSIVQCILKASMGDSFHDVLTQSRIYFGIGIFVQCIALIEMLLLTRNSFAHKYVAEFRIMAIKSGQYVAETEDQELPVSGKMATGEPVMNEDGAAVIAQEKQLDDADEESNEVRAIGSTAMLRAVGCADGMTDTDQNCELTSSDQMLQVSAFSVFIRVWPMMLCTFIVFFTSLLLFPGLFFRIDFSDGWYMTIIVLLFNVGDFSARLLLMVRKLRPNPIPVVIGTFARLAIIPFLVLCVRHIINGHALPYVLITLLGLTNGYFGTMACIHCPRTPTLRLAGERSLAAILGGISVMMGLCAGSNFALLLNLTI